MARLALEINGRKQTIDADPQMPLLWVLRDLLNLTGTKYGCGIGLCGACTVHIDGAATRSCQTPVATAAGKGIVTIEGLADGDTLHPLQKAFWENHGLQCGFCTPGFLMLAAGALQETPDLSDEEIKEVLSSNLCRCTGYQNIIKAVRLAALEMRSGARR